MPASTASGGGAAAVKNSTTCGSGFFSAAGALSSVDITIGAPHRCVTLWVAMASYIAGARTCAQADMRAGDHRDRPGEAPAVAVEHRQRPEIDRMLAHAAGDDVADREQVGAAVVIDHALGIAGGAGGVVERDRVPLVARHLPGEVGIAVLDEILVFDRADALARAGIFRVVEVDHERLHLGESRARPSPPCENSRSTITTLASAWSR